MRERALVLANVILFGMTTLLLATVQTSLWFQILGWFPAPAFWIPVLVYISLYRAPVELVVGLFALSAILSPMTVMPGSLLFMICLLLGGAIRLIKQRFYWAGSSYFMMMSGIAALAWHVFHWLGSMVAGPEPLTSPEVSDWLIQALLTPLTAPPLHELFRWFDRLTDRGQPAEASVDRL